ncbi:MAG: ParB/RepB/Spo0J family partition protein [Campylobacteraceae bacterium]|nr:ParB/RepB/Spo0J family partition protein [Campylobacteraceae bacterium]
MALGRGLSELLGEVETAYGNSTTSATNGVSELNVNSIKANPNQPRKIFDETRLQELSDSIVKHGLLQAISVIKVSDDEYILIAGERRLRAHKLACIDTIKATIIDTDEYKLRELALIENIQRDDLNIIELSYSYAQLINEHNLTHDELSDIVFKSRSSITNTLRLLSLSVYIQQLLGNEKITAGHAKVLIGLSEDDQKKVADSIVGQKLSVRETETLVKNLKNPTVKVIAKKTKKNNNFDFKPLDNLVDLFKSDNLKIKVQNDSITIKINSQEDIEKISKHFGNTL